MKKMLVVVVTLVTTMVKSQTFCDSSRSSTNDIIEGSFVYNPILSFDRDSSNIIGVGYIKLEDGVAISFFLRGMREVKNFSKSVVEIKFINVKEVRTISNFPDIDDMPAGMKFLYGYEDTDSKTIELLKNNLIQSIKINGLLFKISAEDAIQIQKLSQCALEDFSLVNKI